MENVGNFRLSFLDPPSRGFFRPSVPPESLSLILSRVNFRGRCWPATLILACSRWPFFAMKKRGGLWCFVLGICCYLVVYDIQTPRFCRGLFLNEIQPSIRIISRPRNKDPMIPSLLNNQADFMESKKVSFVAHLDIETGTFESMNMR